MKYELIDAMCNSKLIIIKSPFIFIWSGNHTINIFGIYTESELDVFSIGDFSNDKTTVRDFINGVNRYIKSRKAYRMW